MALTKYKLGELISIVNERNSEGIDNFIGINIKKEFMPTVANTKTVNKYNYKIVRKGRFVFSGMQTGRDKAIRLGLYQSKFPAIISPAYTLFEVDKKELIIPQYLMMLFLSEEKNRLGWFLSDSSIRSNLDWDVFCDIEIELPSIEIQQKYVDIYDAMLENQACYERGLEDLKLVCDGYIEDLMVKNDFVQLGEYIRKVDIRNKENRYSNVKGVSVIKEFVEPTSKVNRKSLQNYKLVLPGQISFVQTTNNEKVFANALNDSSEVILVTSVNEVFETNQNKLMPEYLSIILNRSEFDRYARFHSWGSARETFTWDDLCDVKIPIPDIKIQQSIANIYKVYKERIAISERLQTQIKDICPILIKGSLEEVRG